MRRIFASREIATKLKVFNKKNVSVYSFFPVDRADCDCHDLIKKWKDDLALMPNDKKQNVMEKQNFLECPRDKMGMNRYEISCNVCKQIIGYCWATDETLNDWCDLHYVSWSDGVEWHGCLTPNISPIDEKLGLECTCGNDTRDFRANMTLPGVTALRIEEKNKQGRDFGLKTSKFLVKKINTITKPTFGKSGWQK